jgi:hypothetical protein
MDAFKIKLARYVHPSTTLHPNPGFEYYFKACRKGDPEAKAVAIGENPMGVLADASEITGLPRDNFEVHEISKEQFEKLRCP